MDRKTPSLYEILTCNFTGDLPLKVINEEDQVILSVLDNIQRILNARVGTISHLPDYGLPDMTKILFVPVFNSDFREWQKKHNTGGDYIVFSDVLWTPPLDKDRVIEL